MRPGRHLCAILTTFLVGFLPIGCDRLVGDPGSVTIRGQAVTRAWTESGDGECSGVGLYAPREGGLVVVEDALETFRLTGPLGPGEIVDSRCVFEFAIPEVPVLRLTTADYSVWLETANLAPGSYVRVSVDDLDALIVLTVD